MTEPLIRFINLDDTIDLSHLDFKDDKGKDSEKLQWFIKNHAHRHHKENLGLTYVICYNGKNIGYITLATSSVQKKSPSGSSKINTPVTTHLPSIIIAYFAIDKKYRKKGIGKEVLLWVFGLSMKIGEDVGCRYITLYAKNAIEFYQKNGYIRTQITTEKGFVLMYKDLFPSTNSN